MTELQLAVRFQGGAALRSVESSDPHTVAVTGLPICSSKADVEYTADGTLAAAIDAEGRGVVVYTTATGEEQATLSCPNAIAVAFSPRGTFIQTWEKLTDELQQSGGNLRVWDSSTGAFLTGFSQKNFSKDQWPLIQWTHDENISCLAISNGVHLFNGQDMASGVIGKISQDRLTKFAVSPGPAPYKIATFSPEAKDQAASIKLYAYPNLTETISAKSMFRASDAAFLWSPSGAAVLVKTSTDVDATGQSYYGESKLAFMSADGKTEGNVTLGKEGPIHDVAWSPAGREFVVIYGFMPAKATLFDVKCKAVFDFGTGSRNTVAWAPHGRFLVLGGFGNIAGHVEFWDNNRKKQLAAIKAPGTTNWAWSPCSRLFLAATLFPRLRVDNGFRLYKYDGRLVSEEKVPHEMYQLTWRPARPGQYPDRPASPTSAAAGAAAGEASSAAKPPAAPAAYVPPHLRGKGGAAARPTFSLHDYESAGKVGGAGPSLGNRAVPAGLSEDDSKLSKAALKKKKAKDKAARDKEDADALEDTQRALAAAGIAAAAAAKSGPAADADAGPKTYSTAEEVAKRVKAVQKKLKQAEGLVAEQAQGKALNVDQKAKIDAIPGIRAELEELDRIAKAFA